LAGSQTLMQGRRGVVSLQQALMPEGPTRKSPVKEVEEDHEDDDESGDEEGAESQPQALRRPEDVPKPPPGALHPSLGSEGHAIGACKRCCFFPRGRCMNGYECMFCHYEHEKRKRKNKKKNKRAGMAALPTGAGGAVRSFATHSSLGVTMPGYMPHASPNMMMPVSYHQMQQPQPGQLVYSAPQLVPAVTQQDLLSPFQVNNGAYCVLQPTQTLMAAPSMAAYGAMQQPQQLQQLQQMQQVQQMQQMQQQQQLIVLEPASMPQPPQPHPLQQRNHHLEPPPPPPQAPSVGQTQLLPPPPAMAPKFWAA